MTRINITITVSSKERLKEYMTEVLTFENVMKHNHVNELPQHPNSDNETLEIDSCLIEVRE